MNLSTTVTSGSPLIDGLYDNIAGMVRLAVPTSRESAPPLKKSLGEKKWDMSIRLVSGEGKQLEFGACDETASYYYDGSTDRKYHYESTIKLPKMLKEDEAERS
ncbi:hypothetical protein PS15m_006476 [Mucor circinelloides]